MNIGINAYTQLNYCHVMVLQTNYFRYEKVQTIQTHCYIN